MTAHVIEPVIEAMLHGMGFPEGPAVASDGMIYVCDVHGGTIRQVRHGESSVFATVGGGPNGLAFGKGDWLYVANNGGAMRWERKGDLLLSRGFETEGFDARVERVNRKTGVVERVLDEVDGAPLEAIDDLVFSHDGSFWFTDLGRDGPHSRSYGGIYWSSADGLSRRPVAYPLVAGANGIGLSPDGKTLYATEYGAGRLWAWTIDGPGKLRKESDQAHGGYLLWQANDAQLLDSIAITADGSIVIATQPSGVFSVIGPDGTHRATIPMPDHFPTNLCFDPNNPGVAYATLSSTGVLATIRWPNMLGL